jgi:small subunit ribosomal protein S9
MAVVYYEGVGRRKRASARVRLYPGEGNVVVNDKPMEEYFSREGDALHLLEPLKVTGTADTFNVSLAPCWRPIQICGPFCARAAF